MAETEAAISAIQKLPDRFLRTAQAYLVDGMKPKSIAREQGIALRTVYHRLRLIERCAGRPYDKQSKRGRPRKSAA